MKLLQMNIPLFWSLVTVAAVGYLFIVLFFYLKQNEFVYFPQKDISVTPKAFGIGFEEINFRTRDGVSLSGWFVPCTRPKASVLFCHGNAGNVSALLDVIKTYHRAGYEVLVFDYRGYGKSEGKPDEKGTYEDVYAAWSWLVSKGRRPENIIVSGQSLGGAVAAWLASKENCGALVLESVFSSINDLGAEVYPFIPVRLLSKFGYDTAKYVKSVKCPVLVVHSRCDEMVPFKHGKKIYESANEPKEFLEIKGSHNDGYLESKDMYEEELFYFLERNLKHKRKAE